MDRKIATTLTTMFEEQIALLQKNVKILKELQATVLVVPEIKPVVIVDESSVKISKKKPKKIVDPNKPKRPLTGYQLYMADNNTSIKEANPDANATLIMTLLAKGWSSLQTDVKDQYMKKGEQLRESYQRELLDYLSKGGEIIDMVTIPSETTTLPVEKSKKVKAVVPVTTTVTSSKTTSTAPIVPVAVEVPSIEDAEKKKKKKKRSDESINESESQVIDGDKKKKV